MHQHDVGLMGFNKICTRDFITMTTARLMTDFPALDDQQVTLANWRKTPFSQWGFQNVRQLLPTANMARSDTPTS